MRLTWHLAILVGIFTVASVGFVNSISAEQQLSEVKTAEKAVELAMLYTGFDMVNDTGSPSPYGVASKSRVESSRMAFLSDSVNHREVWTVTFADVEIDWSKLMRHAFGSVRIASADVILDSETGRLFEIRIVSSNAQPFPEPVLDVFENESRRLNFNETYHSFCDRLPATTLYDTFRNKRSCFLGAPLIVARYVVESHNFRREKPPAPAWVISALYHGTHEGTDVDIVHSFTIKHAVVDADSGVLELRYDWSASADSLK